LRLREVFEPVLTEVTKLKTLVEKLARRARKKHLTPICCGHDPCCPMHVEPNVLWRYHEWLAAVDAHAHTHFLLVMPVHPYEGLLRRRRSRCCIFSTRKRHEEGVALAIDLIAAVRLECFPQQPPM
jgi:hypothetical protein